MTIDLACVSHHHSTASAESSVLTALRSVGLLDVLHEYACGGLGRDALSGRPFRRFVTSGDEKCRLGRVANDSFDLAGVGRCPLTTDNP